MTEGTRLNMIDFPPNSHFKSVMPVISAPPNQPLIPNSRSKSILSSLPNMDVKSSNPVDIKSKFIESAGAVVGGADAGGGGGTCDTGVCTGVPLPGGLEVEVVGRD